jgi:hypothetical protein
MQVVRDLCRRLLDELDERTTGMQPCCQRTHLACLCVVKGFDVALHQTPRQSQFFRDPDGMELEVCAPP